MANYEEQLVQQINTTKIKLEKILSEASEYNQIINSQGVEEAKFACMGIGIQVYGKSSPQVKQFLDAKKPNDGNFFAQLHLAESLIGFLRNLELEIQGGLVGSIRQSAQSEILADFLLLAKQIDPVKNKDVASVLACAALEDTLKKIALKNDLTELSNKDITDVVNALKSKGLIPGPQGPILSGYVKLRNKTFHAEWDKFEHAEVVSLIAFTETLILQHLSV